VQRAGHPGARGPTPAGRSPTYPPEELGEVIATRLTDPRRLGLPFAPWTLERREAYLNTERGIAMKRGRIDEILLAEGFRWRSKESWFGEGVDTVTDRPKPASDDQVKIGHRVASSILLDHRRG